MNELLDNYPGYKRCSAFCTSENYNLDHIQNYLQDQGQNPLFFRTGQVVHRLFGLDEGDVFYFSYGTVVCWGLSQDEEQAILAELKLFESKPLEILEFEEAIFAPGDAAKIVKDRITIPSSNILTKLAFSHGLAQSVKLEVFEKLVQSRIEQSKHAPENLAKYGRIGSNRKELAKMIGQIVLDRNSINLHTDILDTPEFFWEHSELEPLYRLIAQDLDIVARVRVLNQRLDILKELFEILSNEIENRHSSNLEWIIIVLIFIEVVVTFAKDIFHLI